MVRPSKAGNYLKIGEPFPLDAIKTPGNNEAASPLLLSFAKVSNTKDMLFRQTCQGLLGVSTYLVTSQMASS